MIKITTRIRFIRVFSSEEKLRESLSEEAFIESFSEKNALNLKQKIAATLADSPDEKKFFHIHGKGSLLDLKKKSYFSIQICTDPLPSIIVEFKPILSRTSKINSLQKSFSSTSPKGWFFEYINTRASLFEYSGDLRKIRSYFLFSPLDANFDEAQEKLIFRTQDEALEYAKMNCSAPL